MTLKPFKLGTHIRTKDFTGVITTWEKITNSETITYRIQNAFLKEPLSIYMTHEEIISKAVRTN